MIGTISCPDKISYCQPSISGVLASLAGICVSLSDTWSEDKSTPLIAEEITVESLIIARISLICLRLDRL